MKKCTVEGCENKHQLLLYCKKHYNEYKRYGKILDKSNEIDLKGVCIDKNYKKSIKYKSQISINNKIFNLGSYDTPYEAHEVFKHIHNLIYG